MLGGINPEKLPANALPFDVANLLQRIFRDAIRLHATFEQFENALQGVFDRLESRTPSGKRRYERYLADFSKGYAWALRDQIWREHLEFAYRCPETGEIFAAYPTRRKDSIHRSTAEVDPRKMGDWESAYLWAGTDKPFTAWRRPA